MQQLKTVPKFDAGDYFLETANRGWFSIINPVAKTNILPDPDMVNDYGYYINAAPSSGSISKGTAGIGFPRSYILAHTSPTSAASISTAESIQLSGKYTFSAYVKSLGPDNAIIDIEFSNAVSKSWTVGTDYARIYITASNLNGNYTPKLSCIGAYETSGWQIEEGDLTTYISGNLNGGYIWESTANESPSIRSESEWSGGEEIDLYELGLKVIEVDGLGSPAFAPIVQDIALSNNELFLCSIPEQRAISITGALFGKNFEELTATHGKLLKTIVNVNRPIRMCFHPYTMNGCNESITSCVCFDFIYSDGLGDPIKSLYNQEITIEGISTSPCLNSCVSTIYKSININKYKTVSTGGGNATQLITKTGESIDANITTVPHALIDVVSNSGSIYAMVMKNLGNTFEYSVYSRYANSTTWEELIKIDSQNFSALALVNGKLYVGGEFDGNDIIITNGATVDSIQNSLWVLDLLTNTWNSTNDQYNIYHNTLPNNIGGVYSFSYDPKTYNLIFGGEFDSVSLNSSKNIFGVNTQDYWTYTLNTQDFGTISGSIMSIDNNGNGTTFIGGSFVNALDGDSNPLAQDSQNIFGRYDSKYLTNLNDDYDAPFPFLYNNDVYTGYVSDIFQYNGVTFIGGEFDMATSHHNDPVIDASANNFTQRAYLGNVGWLDPTGSNQSRFWSSDSKYGGRIQPLSATLPTYYVDTPSNTIAYGVFPFITSWVTTPPPTTSLNKLLFKHFDILDGNLIMCGDRFAAQGASITPQNIGGFAEFVFPFGGTPSQGSFVQPSLSSSNSSGRYFSLDSPEFIGIYSAGYGILGPDTNTTIYYNGGIHLEQCSELIDNTAELYINGTLQKVSGIVNVTTQKRILFNRIDILSDTAKITYENQKIVIYTNNYTITPQITLNEGNPLELTGNDRIKILFDLEAANDAIISIGYTPCYLSYSEAFTCRE